MSKEKDVEEMELNAPESYLRNGTNRISHKCSDILAIFKVFNDCYDVATLPYLCATFQNSNWSQLLQGSKSHNQ